MTLTKEQKAKLKENCIAIRDYLKDLVKDCDTDIDLGVDFQRKKDGHPMNISVRKSGNMITVSGFIGGLYIQFDGDECDYNRTLAWRYEEYGIELLTQWQPIKSRFNNLLKEEIATKKGIMEFVLWKQ